MKIYIASCLICLSSLSTWICIVALKPLRFDQTICIACAWRPWVILTVAFAQNGAVQTSIDKFQHESSVFAGRLSRGQSKLLFKLKLRDRLIKVLSVSVEHWIIIMITCQRYQPRLRLIVIVITIVQLLPSFSDIVERTRKFFSKVNHCFGLKPGVSMVTIATILL